MINHAWKGNCWCVHGQYCTFGLGTDGLGPQRANGQNLVAAMITCVSNGRAIAEKNEEAQEKKLRNRGHGLRFLACHFVRQCYRS